MVSTNRASPAKPILKYATFFNLSLGIAAASIFTSCISYTSFGTARLLKEDQVEIMPYVSQSTIMAINDDPDYSPVDVNSTYGISLGFGIFPGLNVTGNFEQISFGSLSGLYGARIGLKKAIRPDKEAVSFCLGYYNASLLRIGVAGYSNFYFNRKIYYCFNPAVNGLIFIGSLEKETPFYCSANIFNNLTFELGNHLLLRPEVSFDVFNAFQGVFWFNYAIAGGFRF